MTAKTTLQIIGVLQILLVLSACGGGSSARPAAVISDPDPVEGDPPLAQTTLGPLISGVSSQIAGVHVWTDYAYDDRATNPGVTPEENGNDADLIQLQLYPDAEALYVKAVLETLIDPAVPLLGIGLDLDGDPNTGAPTLPGEQWNVAGTPLGLERVISISAAGAQLWSWNGSSWLSEGVFDSVIDPDENTLFAEIPNELLGAYGRTWRAVAAVGVSSASWLTGDGAIHDLAYVRDESTSNFQSNLQAAILDGTEDAQQAIATIDLDSLASGVDDIAQPLANFKNTFLYRSSLNLGEGIAIGDTVNPAYTFAGPYQPYAAWFPENLPANPGLIVYLHGSGEDYMGGLYGGTELDPTASLKKLIGDADGIPIYATGMLSPNAVLVTPLGRSLGGPPDGPAVQDYLDVIADVTERLNVDENRVVLTGYSAGGVNTFRLSQLYPDRWAGSVPLVGSPTTWLFEVMDSTTGEQNYPDALENLYNLPFRIANARLDELTNTFAAPYLDLAVLQLQQMAYDYRHWQFIRREHVSLPVALLQCEMEKAIERGRVLDPARVVFSHEPLLDRVNEEMGLNMIRDSAYWVSGLKVRGTSFSRGDKGTVDITSLAFADRQPATKPVYGLYENLSAGRDVCGPNPEANTLDVWYEIGTKRVAGKSLPVSNALEGSLTRVESVTLDLLGMRLSPNNPIRIALSTDGDALLRLVGHWPGAVSIEPEGDDNTVVCPVAKVIEVPLASDSGDVWLRPSSTNCP